MLSDYKNQRYLSWWDEKDVFYPGERIPLKKIMHGNT